MLFNADLDHFMIVMQCMLTSGLAASVEEAFALTVGWFKELYCWNSLSVSKKYTDYQDDAGGYQHERPPLTPAVYERYTNKKKNYTGNQSAEGCVAVRRA